MKKILNYFSKNSLLICLVLILLVSTALKVAEVIGGNFPFTMDQGRDMVDIRHMVVTLTPRLVGPTTSINGVLLGPFWYYFNLAPFILGGGDPSYIVYWQILWYQLSAMTLWFVIKKKNPVLAFIVAFLVMLMPTGFNTARYFWNANSMPFFTAFYFAGFIWVLDALPNNSIHPSLKVRLFLLGLLSGLAMQVEAAFGILLFPFALIYLLLQKTELRKILSLILGFGLTLVPQILFELKHDFIMTKVLLDEFSGQGNMLGDKVSVAQRLAQRWEHLMDLVLKSSHLPPNYVPWLYVAGLIILASLFIKNRNKTEAQKIWTMSFLFVVFSGIFYIAFPQMLKIWYTLGLSIPLVIFLASFLHFFYESKYKVLRIIAAALIIFTAYYSIKSQLDYTRHVALKPSDDRSNMRNELTAVDWVYTNAQGSGFRVYSYLPSVYDFPYNILFWWYGNRKYGYQPYETAYLPNQPEYIRDVDKLWTNKKNLDSRNLTFLIIEEDEVMPIRTEAWLGNFASLCLIKEEVFPWHAKVQMRAECEK